MFPSNIEQSIAVIETSSLRSKMLRYLAHWQLPLSTASYEPSVPAAPGAFAVSVVILLLIATVFSCSWYVVMAIISQCRWCFWYWCCLLIGLKLSQVANANRRSAETTTKRPWMIYPLNRTNVVTFWTSRWLANVQSLDGRIRVFILLLYHRVKTSHKIIVIYRLFMVSH